MADGEKPYRVYRGGRVKGKVPAPPRPERPAREAKPDGAGRFRYPGPGPARLPRPRRWRRWIGIGALVLFALVVVWLLAGYLAFRGGVKAANKRLDRETRSTLAHQGGLLLFHGTSILLLGTDHNATAARAGDRHSDSILLVRTDPDRHRLAYLSILRDLRVDIPGHGPNKINAAFQVGGPPLAARTVQAVTGLPINHLVIVDFADFQDLIDKLGGVTIDVPRPILSNRFDCPYATQAQCERWQGWRFRKGPQHMDGHRALIYSRIRENRLDSGEGDGTRAGRQQQVLEAIAGRLASIGTLVRLPFIGGDLLKPIATDLTPGQFLQLGWVKFRAGRTLHCRLGGTTYGGGSTILADEESRAVIQMVQGRSAPQPPLPGSPYGSGCAVGRSLGTG